MKLLQMLVVDPEDSEISILSLVGVAIIGLLIFGIRFFFRKFDGRMKRRLASYETNRSHQHYDRQ